MTARSASPTTSSPVSNPNQGVLPGLALPLARRGRLAELLGRTIPDEVWNQHPTGHRCLVVPEPVSEQTAGGVLFKPRSVMKRQELEMGAGWIISVGPCFGQPGAPHPVGVLCAEPGEALGAHILYRQYSGTNLRISEEDSEFEGNLIVLTDRDVLTWAPGV